MPIEIRELVIKATVAPTEEGAAAAASGASGNNNNISSTEEIVSLCVERIIEILKEKYER